MQLSGLRGQCEINILNILSIYKIIKRTGELLFLYKKCNCYLLGASEKSNLYKNKSNLHLKTEKYIIYKFIDSKERYRYIFSGLKLFLYINVLFIINHRI